MAPAQEGILDTHPTPNSNGAPSSSVLFWLFLLVLRLFRGPYRWAKKKWPRFFEAHLPGTVNLDTSRMLRRFNRVHRLFFRKNLDNIRFDETEVANLKAAFQKGPVVLLMRHWGQVEYNFFNHLFLKEQMPLVVHNNMVKMGHWMPYHQWKELALKKIDHYMMKGAWPFNDTVFSLPEALGNNQATLLCLNLPKGLHWVERSPAGQQKVFEELLGVQKELGHPIQCVPLHFIYDKHPGRAKPSLLDILFGEKEDPGLLRKIFLFLRNFKKRAVAKIGEPLDITIFAAQASGVAPEQMGLALAARVQKAFDDETKQVTGPKLKSRKAMLDQILNNPKVRLKIRGVADRENVDFESAEKRAFRYLKEIASDIRFTTIQLWDFFLSWLFHTLYDGIEIDEAGIQKLKKVAKDSPLVLLPCHKSHVDYLLMSYVFYQYDLSLPHVCAGINLNFWPLGPIFRWSGGYFIRRTLPDDPLYSIALKSYVHQLMSEGYFQEFFIEGTRSRSGKLFPARTGLLSMMVESYLEGDLEDLHFVPISIGYERVVEENSYLQEMKGAKKQKERFTDLFRLPKFLWRKYGKVYIQFGEPMSLKEALAGRTEADKTLINGLAHDIGVEINRVTTLLPSPLVASAMLSHPKKSITRQEVHDKVRALDTLARREGTRLSESLRENCDFATEEILAQFVKEGLVRLHGELGEDFFTIPEESRLHLDFFKNKGIQAFAEAAVAQLCHRAGGNFEETLKQVQDLLSLEFYFCRGNSRLPRSRGIAPRQDGSDLSGDGRFMPVPFTGNRPYNECGGPDWLYLLVSPVIESYSLVLHSFKLQPFEKMELRPLLSRIQNFGETLRHRGDLYFPESLSRFNIQNALKKFQEYGLVKNHAADLGPAGKNLYSTVENPVLHAELEELLKRLLHA